MIIVSSEEISLIEEEIREEVAADESDKNEKEDNQVEKLNCAHKNDLMKIIQKKEENK